MAPSPQATVRQLCGNRSGPRLGRHRHRRRTVPGPQPGVQCEQFQLAKGYVIVRSPAFRDAVCIGFGRIVVSEIDSHVVAPPDAGATSELHRPRRLPRPWFSNNPMLFSYYYYTWRDCYRCRRRPPAGGGGADAAELASYHAHLY
jgi:hypothetical protein